MKKLILSIILSLTSINFCNAGDGEGSGSDPAPNTNNNQTQSSNSEPQEICIQTILGEYCYIQEPEESEKI